MNFVMPDHFHALITPAVTLERAMQLVKGGFSRRATVDLESHIEVWQRGFTDHRIRDENDYEKYRSYIFHNPVKAGLCELPEAYRYSSLSGIWELDPVPQRLKPPSSAAQ